VDNFDSTPVDDAVLRRAVQCAIAAPNRSGSEPWRFIQVGPQTVEKLVELKSDLGMEEIRSEDNVMSLWTDIPGWCVVTTRVTPDDESIELEDFQSTSCAVQNLMVSTVDDDITVGALVTCQQTVLGDSHICLLRIILYRFS
jgi:nitroreductase